MEDWERHKIQEVIRWLQELVGEYEEPATIDDDEAKRATGRLMEMIFPKLSLEREGALWQETLGVIEELERSNEVSRRIELIKRLHFRGDQTDPTRVPAVPALITLLVGEAQDESAEVRFAAVSALYTATSYEKMRPRILEALTTASERDPDERVREYCRYIRCRVILDGLGRVLIEVDNKNGEYATPFEEAMILLEGLEVRMGFREGNKDR